MCVFTLVTVGVLQTEAGFVSLSYFSAVETQQVIVGEDLHAVVMSRRNKYSKVSDYCTGTNLRGFWG